MPRGARLIRRLARLGCISGISRVYLRCVSGISRVYLGHVSGISRVLAPGAHNRRLRRVQVVRFGVSAMRRRVERHAHRLRDTAEIMPRLLEISRDMSGTARPSSARYSRDHAEISGVSRVHLGCISHLLAHLALVHITRALVEVTERCEARDE